MFDFEVCRFGKDPVSNVDTLDSNQVSLVVVCFRADLLFPVTRWLCAE